MDALANIALTIVLLPLIGALVAGLFGRVIGQVASHRITITLVGGSSVLSLYVLWGFLCGTYQPHDMTVYVWGMPGGLMLQVGFLLDKLSAVMMVVVSFVAWMIHIYTIGYMHDDPGYQRFFSYLSLFTFAMLMLVMSNNFLQLFFGWEAVGLVSYLLIGFWFKKPSAIYANLKAFLVNRLGDFGFLLGIAGIFTYFGSLQFAVLFDKVASFAQSPHLLTLVPGMDYPALEVIAILLFIGAMGKSAQIPLHVWLPDSMEGPTPISALIHAATMVTAGIFMVSRLSPLFEYAPMALSFVMLIGAATCCLMGLLGIIQQDIKRIIAYSTLSQLGYMVCALGVSGYAAGMFHLVTHAFFKALLFLGAGSVIIALHHEQDIRKMGNLKHYLPITYWTMLLGSLSLCGIPGFAGFYSKDLIIEAVRLSDKPWSDVAYVLILSSVFVTAVYAFRLVFKVFHGRENLSTHAKDHLSEPGWVVTLPLIVLAIPSVVLGSIMIGPLLQGFFDPSIKVLQAHDVLSIFFLEHFKSAWHMFWHGFLTPPFWLAIAGIGTAWYVTLRAPDTGSQIAKLFPNLNRLLQHKFGFDHFNEKVLASGTRGMGWFFWQFTDQAVIDGVAVNGSARGVMILSKICKRLQSGYLYHYAFAMIAGFFLLLCWMAWG